MNFFKNFFKKTKYGTGWNIDPYDERRYESKEIYSAFTPVVWTEKNPSSWKKFEPIRNQNGSSSCVSYVLAVILGAENQLEEGKFVQLSPRAIYGKGFEPNGGMFYAKALQLGKDNGAPLEVLLPSEAKGEDEMRNLQDERESDRIVAKTYKGGAFVYLSMDIEEIASKIAEGKAVAFGTRFNSGGFSTGEVVLNKDGRYGHALVGVDFTLWKDEKALVFQNSWSNSYGFQGLGVITETQLKNGGFILAAYYENLTNSAGVADNRPKIQILSPSLKLGDQNGEVMKLQIMLQYLGHFPAGIKVTGYFGGISRKAVKDYQTSRNMTPSGLADGQTIISINSNF